MWFFIFPTISLQPHVIVQTFHWSTEYLLLKFLSCIVVRPPCIVGSAVSKTDVQPRHGASVSQIASSWPIRTFSVQSVLALSGWVNWLDELRSITGQSLKYNCWLGLRGAFLPNYGSQQHCGDDLTRDTTSDGNRWSLVGVDFLKEQWSWTICCTDEVVCNILHFYLHISDLSLLVSGSLIKHLNVVSFCTASNFTHSRQVLHHSPVTITVTGSS